jgi:HSP20 family molecular chaperone IbpA
MQWDAEITEQVPDRCIAWRNTGGSVDAVRVEVRPLDEDSAKVTVSIEYEPQQPGQPMGADPETEIPRRTIHDLVRFKRFVETRRNKSEELPGEAHPGDAVRPGRDGSDPRQASQWTQSPQSQNAASWSQGSDGQLAEEWVPPAAHGGDASQERVPQLRPEEQGGQAASALPSGAPSDQRGPMLTETDMMNPQTWLPNMLRAWEEPFVMMRKMTEDMDRIFERFLGRPMAASSAGQEEGASGTWSPPLEIAQRENQLLIRAELPGIKQKEVHVEIKNDRLIIEGDRCQERQNEERGYRRTEWSYGHFYRSVALPEGINPEQAAASMRDGVLEVTVPLRQTSQKGRHLDIQ